MNKIKKLKTLAAGAVALVATGANAFAASDYVADVQAGIDKAVAIWDGLVPVMIGITVIGIALAFAKRLKRA